MADAALAGFFRGESPAHINSQKRTVAETLFNDANPRNQIPASLGALSVGGVAGERVTQSTESYTTIISRKIQEAYGSAKDVRLSRGEKLPWQYDTAGRLYSTDTEQLKFKINTLRAALELCPLKTTKLFEYRAITDIDADILRSVPMPGDAQKAAYNRLLKLETELALIQTEAKFREDLACWIIGMRPDREYEKCYWVDKQKLHNLPPDSDAYTRSLTEGLSAGEVGFVARSPYPNVAITAAARTKQTQAQRMDIKSLRRANPGITQGMVAENDYMALKKKVFLQNLTRTVPVTEEEAFLWYKYLVLEHPISFEYQCEPAFLEHLRNEGPSPEDIEKSNTTHQVELLTRIAQLEDKAEEDKKSGDKKTAAKLKNLEAQLRDEFKAINGDKEDVGRLEKIKKEIAERKEERKKKLSNLHSVITTSAGAGYDEHLKKEAESLAKDLEKAKYSQQSVEDALSNLRSEHFALVAEFNRGKGAFVGLQSHADKLKQSLALAESQLEAEASRGSALQSQLDSESARAAQAQSNLQQTVAQAQSEVHKANAQADAASTAATQHVLAKESEVRSKEAELQAKDAEKNAALQAKDKENTEALQAKDKDLAAKDEHLQTKDAHIQAKDAELQAQAQARTQLESHAAAQAAYIAQVNGALAAKMSELDAERAQNSLQRENYELQIRSEQARAEQGDKKAQAAMAAHFIAMSKLNTVAAQLKAAQAEIEETQRKLESSEKDLTTEQKHHGRTRHNMEVAKRAIAELKSDLEANHTLLLHKEAEHSADKAASASEIKDLQVRNFALQETQNAGYQTAAVLQQENKTLQAIRDQLHAENEQLKARPTKSIKGQPAQGANIDFLRGVSNLATQTLPHDDEAGGLTLLLKGGSNPEAVAQQMNISVSDLEEYVNRARHTLFTEEGLKYLRQQRPEAKQEIDELRRQLAEDPDSWKRVQEYEKTEDNFRQNVLDYAQKANLMLEDEDVYNRSPFIFDQESGNVKLSSTITMIKKSLSGNDAERFQKLLSKQKQSFRKSQSVHNRQFWQHVQNVVEKF